jgi:hypothetical protein
MTTWLAGMLITADRLNDATLKTSTTTGLTAGTDFSVNTFSGRRVNGVTTVHVYCQYTGTGINVAAPGDNIVDTTMATLPSGWRPPETMNTNWGSGNVDGECTISSAGVISLRSTLNDIVTNANIRVTATWISEND